MFVRANSGGVENIDVELVRSMGTYTSSYTVTADGHSDYMVVLGLFAVSSIADRYISSVTNGTYEQVDEFHSSNNASHIHIYHIKKADKSQSSTITLTGDMFFNVTAL